MELLQNDVDAIARIVDRCSPGGGDNKRGVDFDSAKAEHQFEIQFEDLKLAAFEMEALRREFDTQVAEAQKVQ